jgi:hypothetical protein
MNHGADNLVASIHRLATALAQGPLSPADEAEFADLLRSSSEARRTYLEYTQDTASLRWITSGHCDRSVTLAPDRQESLAAGPPAARWSDRWLGWAVAAALAALAAFVWRASGREAVATVTVLEGVAWSEGASSHQLLSRVNVGERVRFDRGTMELTFDTGAQVTVFGPAEFRVASPMSMNCSLGRVTTLVGESGKGFTINTPKARIVDLGTQFGVDVSAQGDTKVVVFQGSVDLMQNSAAAAADAADAANWTRRMRQGEALQVDAAGDAQRLVAVERGRFFPAPGGGFGFGRRTPTIVDVRDNIRAGESTKCYQIVHGGLEEDAPCFVDRAHQWNGMDEFGLPEFLVGADYIMPFNDDKFVADLAVEVDVARPATCYVFLDVNMKPPRWLLEDFQNTGHYIGLDGAKTVWHRRDRLDAGPGKSVDFAFSVWKRDVPAAGTVALGGVTPPKEGTRPSGFNMYGIAVVPK